MLPVLHVYSGPSWRCRESSRVVLWLVFRRGLFACRCQPSKGREVTTGSACPRCSAKVGFCDVSADARKICTATNATAVSTGLDRSRLDVFVCVYLYCLDAVKLCSFSGHFGPVFIPSRFLASPDYIMSILSLAARCPATALTTTSPCTVLIQLRTEKSTAASVSGSPYTLYAGPQNTRPPITQAIQSDTA